MTNKQYDEVGMCWPSKAEVLNEYGEQGEMTLVSLGDIVEESSRPLCCGFRRSPGFLSWFDIPQSLPHRALLPQLCWHNMHSALCCEPLAETTGKAWQPSKQKYFKKIFEFIGFVCFQTLPVPWFRHLSHTDNGPVTPEKWQAMAQGCEQA